MKTESCPDCDVMGEWFASNGKCSVCHGTGYRGDAAVVFEVFSPEENQICQNCHGSGKCPTCHGEGVVEGRVDRRNESNNHRKSESSHKKRRTTETKSSYSSGYSSNSSGYSSKGGGQSYGYNAVPKVGESNRKSFMFIWYVLTAVALSLVGIVQVVMAGESVFEIFAVLFISVLWPIILAIAALAALLGVESAIKTFSIGIPLAVGTGVISAIIYSIRNQK